MGAQALPTLPRRDHEARTRLHAAAATAVGEWAAVVDPDGTFGGRAAADAGVALERCAVVRRVPADRWSTVVAALLDGVAVVIAAVPPYVRTGDARRLTARARERAAVLVALGGWPAEASVRLHVRAGVWHGLDAGSGLLATRDLEVRIEGRETTAKATGGEPERGVDPISRAFAQAG